MPAEQRDVVLDWTSPYGMYHRPSLTGRRGLQFFRVTSLHRLVNFVDMVNLAKPMQGPGLSPTASSLLHSVDRDTGSLEAECLSTAVLHPKVFVRQATRTMVQYPLWPRAVEYSSSKNAYQEHPAGAKGGRRAPCRVDRTESSTI